MNGISMKGKSLVVLGALLMLTACSNDSSEDSQQKFSTDAMAGYDGPLSVSISMTNSGTTRALTKWDNTQTDALFGRYPFPYSEFAESDAVGIVYVLKRDGEYQVFNYKAVTADGGATWTVQDTEGNPATIRYYSKFENYYYAYTPYVEGGLNSSDYLLSKIEEAAGGDVSAYDFLEPKVHATLSTYSNQSALASYTACDLLGAKGICTPDEATKTATLDIHLDHLMALDIIKLKNWDGKVTIYGCYDTWVAPDKTIWRMKQRLQPVVDQVTTGDVAPKTAGILDNWYVYDADTCKFYMRLVEPGVEQKKFGCADYAINGGWLLDIPGIPSGYFVLLNTSYYRYFRTKSFVPSPSNEAGTIWNEEKNLYFSDASHFDWTYEDILFGNSELEYDYDQVLELNDYLLADGNISKSVKGVGTVKWIAYAPQPWLATPGFFDGWEDNYLYFYDMYVAIPERLADNGYRAKGRVEVTNERKHTVVDYAAHGYSSNDGFWATEVCNHFLAFYDETVEYKASAADIKHDDEIFSLALPQVSYSDSYGLYSIDNNLDYIQGFIPYTWSHVSANWHLNKDGVSGIRSNQTAKNLDDSKRTVNGVSWMVPTASEYYIAYFPEDTSDDYLTCSYLPVTGSAEKEGIVTVQPKYSIAADMNLYKKVYFGNGYLMNIPRRLAFTFNSYDCMPIAYQDNGVVKKDHLYIHNSTDTDASVIAPSTIYRPCIAF